MHSMHASEHEFTSTHMGQLFLNFYRSHGHKVIPGSSLLDPSVPMTFVMSAGLAQVETSANRYGGRKESQYTLLQNCFRHFDMEIIGKSATHLSLFQMPGAFTFGPIDKHGIISRIWILLTEIYGFDPRALWITYFAGDEVAGCSFDPDSQTYDAWRSVGVTQKRIIGQKADQNFWKQSANIVGKKHVPKCGPNTEVFFDRGEHLKCGIMCGPGCGCGRFVEIMNTLFIMLHMDDQSGAIKALDEPFTETVVGAERVAMSLQKVSSIFEIDSINPLITSIARFTKTKNLLASDYTMHMHIIADHIRAILFLVADGAPPAGKGGRARLMRILVRKMLTSQKLLEIMDSFFIQTIVNTAIGIYAAQHPNLISTKNTVIGHIEKEKQCFENTLKSGYCQLDRMLTQRGGVGITGEDMLNLEKCYGVPIPLMETKLADEQIRFCRHAYQKASIRWKQDLSDSR